MTEGWVKVEAGGGEELLLQVGGIWDARNVTRLDPQLRGLGPAANVTLDLSQLERLDTAGAWLLFRTLK
ncbi:MAG: STAS domain-containing protein, partial [Rhodospirillaceae bacterium]|nr:STAS domain-containing protein [Rhodospirillaceae bacterium]